jgi:hypothetical protein
MPSFGFPQSLEQMDGSGSKVQGKGNAPPRCSVGDAEQADSADGSDRNHIDGC